MRRGNRTMRAARLRALAGLMALLGLGGCGGAASLALTGASLVSLVTTDKLLTDHLVSWARDEDCSAVKAAEDEGYCRPPAAGAADDTVLVVKAPLYCYRTLGAVTCYDAPDPQASPGLRVGSPPPAP